MYKSAQYLLSIPFLKHCYPSVDVCVYCPLEGVMRSKRRCVLEKKQPYSGDEWCSGPDTEEDEDKPHTATHRESVCLHWGGETCFQLLLVSECPH